MFSVCKKVASYMADILEDQVHTLASNLKAGDSKFVQDKKLIF